MRNNRVNIITLGCSKNLVDSQKLLRQLEAGGYVVSAESEDPSEVVIINTCGFIHDAREESIDTILRQAELIRERGRGQLFVMGCMVEKYRKELSDAIPEVTAWFGVNRPEEVTGRLGLVYNENLYGERVITGPRHYAYMKISEGCDRTCSFCAIPDIRGRYTSVPEERLIAEAETLAAGGVKELILIAQDITLYGYDIYGKPALTSLVDKLTRVNGIEWVRLHYLYPSDFPYEILDMMQDNEKICKYIDLPIQHTSDHMLSLMRRTHRGSDTRELLYEIRRRVPEAAIRTTVIAGHPGETEDDFRELMDFLGEFRFDRLGAFGYSHEENTHSYLTMKDDIPERVKQKRVAEIMEQQQAVSLELNRRRVGQIMKVLIDRREGLFNVGRSQFDSPEVDQEILITSGKIIEPGTFVNIRVTGSAEFDLYGELIP